MTKILKNNTASDVLIVDVGQTVPASSQLTINVTDYDLYAASSDVITLIGNSTLTMNDGSSDLSISDASKLIQGIFPNTVALKDINSNPVGVTNNALNVHLDLVNDDPSGNPNYALPVQLPGVQDMTNRLKVVSTNSIIETTWQYTDQPERWSKRLTGGATIGKGGQKDPAYLKAECTTAVGDKVEFQTKRFLIYSPFRTHILTTSTIFGPGDPNVRKRIGQFTDFNGWFFEQHGNNIYAVVLNNTFELTGTNEDRTERSLWNIDRFDGTGPSGLTISPGFQNDITLVIEFVWHGTQGVKFGIQYFDRIYWGHFVIHSDTALKPFSRSALLPIRYEMENTGTPSSPPVWWIGPNSFNIEGGEEQLGFPASVNNGTVGTSLTNASGETVLIAIRPKLQINGINNRGSIIPLDFEIVSTDNMLYKIYDQVIFGDGTWTSVSNQSIAEYSTNTTVANFTDGFIPKTGYVPAGANKATIISNTFEGSIAAFVDPLNSDAQLGFVITGEKINNNLTSYVSINWKEVY